MVDKTRKPSKPSKPSETTKTSKAKIDANRRYNEKTFDVLQCRIKKDEHINQRIDDAVESINATIDDPKAKISKASFILDAIKAKLDGQSAAPTPAPEPAPAIPSDMEQLTALTPANRRINYRIAGAVKYGYGASKDEYILHALETQLKRDEDAERERRSARTYIQHGHPGDDGYDPDDPGDQMPCDDDY